MLSSFFDESGDEQDPKSKICGMAGCIASSVQWDKFSIKWKDRLDRDGLAYFHMKEYAHSTGIFTEWKGDEPRRRLLLGDLWDLIEEVNPLFCGAFIPLEYYRDALDGYQRKELVGSYFLTYQSCIAMAFTMFHMEDGDRVEEMITVFDDKKGFRERVNDFYDFLLQAADYGGRMPPPIFRDMRQILPLQAADMVAYESHREYARRLYDPEKKPRWGFLRLEGIIRQTTPFPEIGPPGTPIIFHGKEMIDRMKESFNNPADNLLSKAYAILNKPKKR